MTARPGTVLAGKSSALPSRRNHALIDIAGMVFGTWKVLGRSPNSGRSEPSWRCECTVCAHVVSLTGHHLRKRTPKCPLCHPALQVHWRKPKTPEPARPVIPAAVIRASMPVDFRPKHDVQAMHSAQSGAVARCSVCRSMAVFTRARCSVCGAGWSADVLEHVDGRGR